MRKIREDKVVIDKLVHGGQGIGTASDGRKCFVWGALPGETVKVQITKGKHDWCEGFAVDVVESSPYRIEPIEQEIYLATSPWQIIDYQKESDFKQGILNETFERENINVNWLDFYQPHQPFGYRNKMEYNFWFFNEAQKVSLALHRRGSHQKVAVDGSKLASDAINTAGQVLIKYVNDNNIEARPLKSVILRSDSTGNVGMSLFVNEKAVAAKFANFIFQAGSLEIVYSNPKSPASVVTEVLQTNNNQLTDKILGRDFIYSTRSFFQVNLSVYEKVLEVIANYVKKNKIKNIVDMYSGVGSIGLSVVGDDQKLTMVEVSEESTKQAKLNMVSRPNCQVVTATSESVLDYLTGEEIVILDPPRAGLHKDVTEKLAEIKPREIIYLSCNPSTQARDVKVLLDVGYKIKHAQGFNFFPRTPHIESLLILQIAK